MPYSGASDDSLPKAVQKLPKSLRELWVKVFNEYFAKDGEEAAFRSAWGAVRKVQSAQKARELIAVDLDDVRPWLLGVKATKTDRGMTFSSSAYLHVPDAEKPSTWKLRIEEEPGQVTVAQLGRAAAALSEKGFMGNPVAGISDDEREAYAKKLIGLYRSHKAADSDIPEYLFEIADMDDDSQESEDEDAQTGAKALAQFSVKEVAPEQYRWLLISSGAFEDRDQEVMSTQFLESALDFAERTGRKGALNLLHIPHSDVGTCDFQMLVGQPPLLVESGLFDATPAGRKAAAYYRDHAPEQGASLEYAWADQTPDGVYQAPGVIVRRSILPRAYAAFPWSALSLKESAMNRSEKIAEFARVMQITEPEAEEIVKHLESGTKELADYGVRWKAINESADTAPAPAPVAPEPETAVDAVAPPAPAPESVAAEPSVTAPVTEPLEVVITPETLTKITDQVMQRVDGLLTELRASLATVAQSLVTVTQGQEQYALGLKEVKATVEALKTSDDAKIAAAVKDLPRATVKSIAQPARPSERTPDKQATPEESMLAKAAATLYG